MISLLQIQIDPLDYFSLISSITSIILGIVAIVLSILFYRMSEKMGRENEKVSTNIQSNVTKLEELFNKLYTGTFDMMKETVTDMRKHVYKTENNNLSTVDNQNVLNQTVASMSDEIERLKSRKTDEKEITKIVEEILTKSKKIESDIKSKKVREEILSFLRVKGKIQYGEIDKYLRNKGLLSENDGALFIELEKLAKEGITNNPFGKTENDETSISHADYVFLI